MSELTLPSSAFGAANDPLQDAPAGFSFDNYHRNQMLLQERQKQRQQEQQLLGKKNNQYPEPISEDEMKVSEAAFSYGSLTSASLPQPKKTGTTIVGALFAGGVILGADTRATNGDLVAEKNCDKIHYMAPNMYCCGAGTAADTEMTTNMIASQLELLRMETHSESRVVTALTLLKRLLFRYQGHIGAAMILGGCDVSGAHLYQCFPHGSTSRLAFSSMGSGSLGAMAVLETTWRQNMTEPECLELVQRAIAAGIWNDSASGGNIDICILRSDGTKNYHRNMVTPNDVGPLKALINRSNRLNMRPGLTPLLKTTYTPHPVVKNPATLADVTVTEMEVESTS